MTTAKDGNLQVVSSYSYNADGQRVRRKVGSVETWQVYGMDGELLAEYAASGPPASPQKEYGYRNGQLLITAEPTLVTEQNVTWTSVSSTLQVTGNSLQKTSGTNSWYDAGAVSTQSMAWGDGYVEFTPGSTTTWRMIGLGNGNPAIHYSDIEYALYVGPAGGLQIYEAGILRGSFGAYAGTDRFTSSDPLMASATTVNPKTWNRYAYALNNPLRFTDPTGLRTCWEASCSGQDDANDGFQTSFEGEDPEAQGRPPSANSRPEAESTNPASQQEDLELALLLSDCDAIARGSDTRQADATYGNHFNTPDGVQHSTHIYGDTSGNKVVGLFVPKGFKLVYEGGENNQVRATNSVTKQVLVFVHVAGVNRQADVDRNLALNKTNSRGSTYFGQIGGKGGDQDNYRHAHVTLYNNAEGRKSIVNQVNNARFPGTGRITNFRGYGNISSLFRR